MTSVSMGIDTHGNAPALELDLEANVEAPAAARAALAGFCQGRDLSSSRLATAILLLSEIMTNAVVHPKPKSKVIRLLVRLDPGLVHVEVTDQGRGFIPRARDPSHTGGGYGLYLVDKEANRWGVDYERGTTVWFEVAT